MYMYIYIYIYIYTHTHTSRECPSGAYSMQKVEELIDRLGWAKFIVMLDLTHCTQVSDAHCSGKVKVKGKKKPLSKFYSSQPSS